MMGRGLEQSAGCLLNLDPVQSAPLWCMQGTSTAHTYHLTIRLRRAAFGESIELFVRHRSVNYASGTIVKRCNCIGMIYCATAAGGPRVEMMSIILLLPVSISTDRSTDRPCALDMCNAARSFRSFKHESNTCVIRRLKFINIVFIVRLSCTPLPATLHTVTASQNSGLSMNRSEYGEVERYH